jgi:GT2 family glycosyltransferase
LFALNHFDIIGVAGNTRIVPNQPAWLFSKIEDGKFVWDKGTLSGSIGHGQLRKGQRSLYGPTPESCKLLDGAFLAIRSEVVHRSHLLFDERFKFHFYDMDFCRCASRIGLSLGTWPIELTHQSAGAFGNPAWQECHERYFEKWKS